MNRAAAEVKGATDGKVVTDVDGVTDMDGVTDVRGAPTPVTVLTGFLGAGKTTLLNDILTNAGGRRIAVLVNDFGSINIDARLVVSVEEDRIALSNGCICCTIRDDLVSALVRLLRTDPVPEHVVIEASGISEPVGIAETFFQPELEPLMTVNAMVVVCDAAAYPELDFENTEMVLRQVSVADIVLINKVDIANPSGMAQLKSDIDLAAPRSRCIETIQARLPMSLLFGPARAASISVLARQLTDTHVLMPHRHEHTHDDGAHHGEDEHASHSDAEHTTRFGTWSWTDETPLDLTAFQSWVAQLPRTIYRAKGILRLAEHPDREAVFQLVGKRSTIELGSYWRGQPLNELVVIGAADAINEQALLEGVVATRSTSVHQ